jgi:hypothetical protein
MPRRVLDATRYRDDTEYIEMWLKEISQARHRHLASADMALHFLTTTQTEFGDAAPTAAPVVSIIKTLPLL